MADILSKLWIVNNTVFISVTVILVIIHAVLSFLSIRKLLGVRQEPEHSARELKIIFWYLVVSLNIISTVSQLFGWSEEFTGNLSFRYICEALAVLFKFLFTFILLNTVFIIQTVLVMAKGNGNADVDWFRYYSAVATLIPLPLMRLSWPALVFYTSRTKGTLVFDLKNTERARALINNATVHVFASIIRPINGSYAQYEFAIRILLSSVLGFLLWDVANLMKTQRSLTAVRKYKLKEWSIFTVSCILISLVIVYEGLANIKHANKKKAPAFWHPIFFDFLGQTEPDDIPNDTQIVGLHDLLSIFTSLSITSILTLLAPCRNVKKGK